MSDRYQPPDRDCAQWSLVIPEIPASDNPDCPREMVLATAMFPFVGRRVSRGLIRLITAIVTACYVAVSARFLLPLGTIGTVVFGVMGALFLASGFIVQYLWTTSPAQSQAAVERQLGRIDRLFDRIENSSLRWLR
jgi:hypothetical protein